MERGMTWVQEMAMRNSEIRKKAAPPIKAKDLPAVIKKLKKDIEKSETRQQEWKRLNPEKVKTAQAKLMRKRREKKVDNQKIAGEATRL